MPVPVDLMSRELGKIRDNYTKHRRNISRDQVNDILGALMPFTQFKDESDLKFQAKFLYLKIIMRHPELIDEKYQLNDTQLLRDFSHLQSLQATFLQTNITRMTIQKFIDNLRNKSQLEAQQTSENYDNSCEDDQLAREILRVQLKVT